MYLLIILYINENIQDYNSYLIAKIFSICNKMYNSEY